MVVKTQGSPEWPAMARGWWRSWCCRKCPQWVSGAGKVANDCEGLGSHRSPSRALGSIRPRSQGAGNCWAKARGSIWIRLRRGGRNEAFLDAVPPLSVPALPTRQHSQGSLRTGVRSVGGSGAPATSPKYLRARRRGPASRATRASRPLQVPRGRRAAMT